MGRVLGALAAVVLCAACSRVEVPPPSPTSTPTPAPCTVEQHVPEPVTATTAAQQPGPATGVGPDVAPHNAENNGWKQRKPLNARGVQTGRDTIAQIGSALQQVCASGDFSVEATKKALAGYEAYVLLPDAGQKLVGYTITVSNGPTERATCVYGDLKPRELRIFVDGTTGEGSCYEPKSH
ncbi:MAG TPA: hypothetical protein VF821_07190 [Lentzea sp.]